MPEMLEIVVKKAAIGHREALRDECHEARDADMQAMLYVCRVCGHFNNVLSTRRYNRRQLRRRFRRMFYLIFIHEHVRNRY